MARYRFGLLLLALLAGIAAPPAKASVQQMIVFLTCEDPESGASGAGTRSGTGVIVSSQGHVLTAGHVVPEGGTCRGAIGVADRGATRQMVVQPVAAPVDVALLRFTAAQDYTAAETCRLEDWMVLSPIRSAGFPSITATGAPLFFDGILSSPIPDAEGLLDTSAGSVRGMSGGPVFTKDLRKLVGIIVGATYDSIGAVVSYKILPVSTAMRFTMLDSDGTPCFPRSPVVDLPPEIASWSAARGETPIGLGVEDADCFLVGISGLMNDPGDRVGIEIRDGQYVLVGDDRNGGNLRAMVRCVHSE